ncbi:hypothetical protein PybrP1_009964, partial [[Pythium] brassicae (nom. inval.)]
KKCRQFGRHRISPRDLIAYIESTFADESERVFEGVLARIMDDERRATLLLSYHAVHRVVETTCCGWITCFNCKRARSRDEPCACEDEEELDEENDLVQCRKCRAMLVKVDGCDAVQCMCGFPMDWADELSYRWRMQRQLLAVDPFDTTVFEQWVGQRHQLLEMFADLWDQGRVKVQLKMLAKSHPGFAPALRQFVWRRRITRVRRSPAFAAALHDKYADRVLVPLLRPVVQTFVSRRRAAKAEDERRRAERQLLVRRKAALNELRQKFFWNVYNDSHAEEQAALAAEECAFATHFNVALVA